jgi:hypothetical protein
VPLFDESNAVPFDRRLFAKVLLLLNLPEIINGQQYMNYCPDIQLRNYKNEGKEK